MVPCQRTQITCIWIQNDPNHPPPSTEKKSSATPLLTVPKFHSPLGYHVPKGIGESTHPPLCIPHLIFRRRLVATRYRRRSWMNGLLSSFPRSILALWSRCLDPSQLGIHLVVNGRIRFAKGQIVQCFLWASSRPEASSIRSVGVWRLSDKDLQKVLAW